MVKIPRIKIKAGKGAVFVALTFLEMIILTSVLFMHETGYSKPQLHLKPPFVKQTVQVPLPQPTQIGHAYGIATGGDIAGLSPDQLANRLDGIKASGASWIRFDLNWANVQPSNAHDYQWSQYDHLVAASRARDIKMLVIVDYTPAWARLKQCNSSDKCQPANPDQYAAFTAAASKRYAPLGVHNWEIWNEPNNPNFWQPASSPSQYVQLLKKAYLAIRGQDSTALIITGGLSPQSTAGSAYSPIDFLKGLYAQDGKNYFDGVGDHPYTFPLSPSSNAHQAWDQMANQKNGLRQIMVSNGDTSKKIWITEFGAPTGGPGTVATIQNLNLSQHPFVVGEPLQARILSDATQFYQGYDWVGPFFVYSYQDTGTDQSTNENFFGLIRSDGTQKPAYTVFKAAASSL